MNVTEINTNLASTRGSKRCVIRMTGQSPIWRNGEGGREKGLLFLSHQTARLRRLERGGGGASRAAGVAAAETSTDCLRGPTATAPPPGSILL